MYQSDSLNFSMYLDLQSGIMMFIAGIRQYEANDEIKAIAAALKDKFIPPAMAAMLGGMMGGQ